MAIGWLLPVLVFSCPVRAEDPVYFPDPVLKEAVEAELWIEDPTPTQMLGLTRLWHPLSWGETGGISNLGGLEYARNLTELNLRYNQVTDLSPLSGLPLLQSLNLLGNGLKDISPLSGLPALAFLDLESNEITDISALAGLPSLSSVCLHRNFISDISPLGSLTSLTWVDLRALPLNQDAYDTYIPQIEANNPGVTLLYDGLFEGQLTITSTVGGHVINPGEGTFTTTFGASLMLEAKADPGYVFAGWSGSCTTTENPLPLTIDQDYTLRANFLCILSRLDVDDDASGDPGPGDPGVSDPRENGTAEHPFDSITEAIGVASAGATIVIYGGTYRETIDCLGKSIELTGFDPNDPNQAAWPMIDGAGKGPVVSFAHGEDPNCRLSGLVITGGQGRSGGAIQCVKSSPTITHCLITGNRATDWNGAVIVCTDSRAAFINCTVAENRGGQFGAALYAAGGGVTVINSILWGNGPREIATEGVAGVEIRYSLVAGGWLGEGNLSGDPMFAGLGRWVSRSDPDTTVRMDDAEAVWAMGDYHVQSQWGRWAPGVKAWLQDAGSSPCIDAGDPSAPVGQEPLPNGGRINLGVYGGTNQASLSADD